MKSLLLILINSVERATMVKEVIIIHSIEKMVVRGMITVKIKSLTNLTIIYVAIMKQRKITNMKWINTPTQLLTEETTSVVNAIVLHQVSALEKGIIGGMRRKLFLLIDTMIDREIIILHNMTIGMVNLLVLEVLLHVEITAKILATIKIMKNIKAITCHLLLTMVL